MNLSEMSNLRPSRVSLLLLLSAGLSKQLILANLLSQDFHAISENHAVA